MKNMKWYEVVAAAPACIIVTCGVIIVSPIFIVLYCAYSFNKLIEPDPEKTFCDFMNDIKPRFPYM
jgi:hypothetical protein